MNAAGIIVEYNPLHNGHLYHINETRKKTNCDVLIAVMSGSFLQRGEPALISKWDRTKMALAAGCDLVVELPVAFSSQNADLFASGAVFILNSLGTDVICFGSENGEIESFYQAAEAMKKDHVSYDNKLKSLLKEGVSYPSAHSTAFKTVIGEQSGAIDLSKPNNILGFQYILAGLEQAKSIKFETITRKNAGYHDLDLKAGGIASATSLRRNIFSEGLSASLQNYMPESTYSLLVQAKAENRLVNWETFFPHLKYKLLTSTTGELAGIHEASEGLEHRFKKYISKAETFESFIQAVKTKRYTRTRLQRFCVHLLLNNKKEEVIHRTKGKSSPYVRLLGMNATGRKHLNQIRERLPVPLITKARDGALLPLFDIDIKAEEVYEYLGEKRPASEVYKRTPIICR